MSKIISKKPESKIKILKVMFWIFTVALILWAMYSLYTYYREMQKDIEISDDQSYIDKDGIKQVKLKLENQK